MNAITFDTYKIVKRLTSEGITEKQATVIVDAIQEGREVDLSHLATKTDIAELKAEVVKWMFGGFLAVIGLSITILLKLH